eukprot:1134675-Pelagomonas_calceolata.AAC.2
MPAIPVFLGVHDIIILLTARFWSWMLSVTLQIPISSLCFVALWWRGLTALLSQCASFSLIGVGRVSSQKAFQCHKSFFNQNATLLSIAASYPDGAYRSRNFRASLAADTRFGQTKALSAPQFVQLDPVPYAANGSFAINLFAKMRREDLQLSLFSYLFSHAGANETDMNLGPNKAGGNGCKGS